MNDNKFMKWLVLESGEIKKENWKSSEVVGMLSNTETPKCVEY